MSDRTLVSHLETTRAAGDCNEREVMILNHRPGKTEASISSVLLVVLAVGQVVSGALSGLFGGAFTTADRPGEPPIVPAGYTFSIWGLIEAFSVAFAIWAFFARRTGSGADRELIDRLTRPMLVVFAGFSVWLAAAELEPTWSTFAVFVIMFLALLRALSELRRGQARLADWSRLGRVLTYGTVGLYAGWSSIAIWLNLTTALAGSGAPITGTAGILGQLAILAGATATAVALLVWMSGLLPYAAAVCWAFIGAVIGAAAAGQPALAAGAAIGFLIVAVTTVALRVARTVRTVRRT